MTIKNFIQDGEGTSRTAGVTEEHALKVAIVENSVKNYISLEDFDILTRKKLYVTLFRNSSNSAELNVDGSVTAQEFYIETDNTKLQTIHTVRFVLNDEQMALSSSEGKRFASAASSPGLTNGLEMFVDQGVITNFFVTPLKQLAEFTYYADHIINEPGALGGGLDLLVVTFKMPVPLVIPPGSTHKIVVKVQDNLSSLDRFNVFALGSQELI